MRARDDDEGKFIGEDVDEVRRGGRGATTRARDEGLFRIVGGRVWIIKLMLSIFIKGRTPMPVE
jgi:hypothetical protein